MRGIFTREERAVVLFLAVSLLVGSAVVQARRVFPSSVADFGGTSEPPGRAPALVERPTGPVDVNTAGVDELVRLPGVGPVRAREIVRQRTLRGGYSSLDELLDVRGIGPVTLEKLRGEATVGAGVASTADSLRTTAEPGS
ncbi:MAG: helix-hairpin-helix domain-containing protein [Candidatus Eisenbacteria bacterium]